MTSRLLLTAALIALAACDASVVEPDDDDGGRSDTGGADGGGARNGSDDDTAGTPDASSVGSTTSTGGTGGSEPLVSGLGWLRLLTIRTSPDDEGGRGVSAVFTTAPDPADECVVEAFGSCAVWTCPAQPIVTEGLVSAGTITFEGLGNALSVSPVDGAYSHDSVDYPADSSGPRRFSATGDVVPAFDVELPAPPRLRVTSPDLDDRGPSLVRGEDYTLAWDSVASSSVVYVSVSGSGALIECTGHAEDGTLTIPGAALAQLAAGEAGFVFATATESRLAIGGFDVSFAAGDYQFWLDAVIE